MTRSYEVWMGTDRGERLWLFDNYLDIEFVNRINGPGYFYMTIPATGFDTGLLRVDNLVQIWRKDYLGTNQLEFIGFLRRWKFVTIGAMTEIELSGPDQNELLQRRIVAYAAGSANAAISVVADNGLKDIFDTNFLASATDAAREIQALGVTVAEDLSAGSKVDKAFAWRNVLEVMQDINEVTRTQADEVFFNVALVGVDEDSVPSFRFTTYTGQPGSDRTVNGTDPVIFSLELGNLRDPVLDYDYTYEENYIYVGGQGEGAARNIVEVTDTDRTGTSQWNRREGFADARHVNDNANLTEEGQQRLSEMRPRVRFSGKLLDSEQTPYRFWLLGDKVTVYYLGRELDVLIRSVYFRVNRSGSEDVLVDVEAVDV